MLLNLVYFIGFVKFMSLASKALLFFKRHFSQKAEPDLAKRYGKGSWAVVTGASDGMGAEYCR